MEEVARFQARTRGLPSFGEADVAVQGLVRALRHYMGGHLDLGWGYSARRYRPLEVPPPEGRRFRRGAGLRGAGLALGAGGALTGPCPELALLCSGPQSPVSSRLTRDETWLSP